ncbi:MAG: hypothetical protein HYU24_07515 [Candidatus Rokubacteria bacterium]|nr:hypothetical protein [Candidatus Rokubacteria bacterium]
MSLARRRLPFMALAGLSLLAALWAGMLRLGWSLPMLASTVPPNHGPLMVTGFLGTLIGLERAVALKRRWPYGAPLFAGLGALALLAGLSVHVGHALTAAGSLFLVAIFVLLYRQQPAAYLATMGIGALLLFVGTGLWHFGFALYRVAPWWIGFLVLTIAGERLELSRLLRPSAWGRAGFLLAEGVFLLGLIVGFGAHAAGIRLSGLGLLALSLWLLRHDIAWHTLRREGRPRFMAVCLLSGHLWLGIGGLLWLLVGNEFAAGPYYDAMLHAIFLGFVFSMIFGHAPIILPSILGVALPFRLAFYAHWALLHVSLALRVGSDLALWLPGQRWGGLGNALAIVLFLGNSVRAIVAGQGGPDGSD